MRWGGGQSDVGRGAVGRWFCAGTGRRAVRGVSVRRTQRAAQRDLSRLPDANGAGSVVGGGADHRGCTEPAQPARHQGRRRRRDHSSGSGHRRRNRRGDRRFLRRDTAPGHAAAREGAAARVAKPGQRMTGALLTLLNAPALAAYTASGLWGDDTIYAIAVRHARETPAAFTVRDCHRRLTYAALVEAADRLAASLAGHGVRSGERVAVWLPSRVETAIALLACSRNGYVCCPSLHRDHRVGEVVALVDRMRAAAVIAQPRYGTDADRYDLFAQLADRDFVRTTYRVGPPGAATAPFADLTGSAVEITVSHDANQVMYLPFTSGTTGEPKGVLHSDNSLLATARMMVRDWRLERSVLYTFSPLSHNLGLGALITALSGGGELVVHDLPRGDSLLDRLEETGAAFLFGVPTHATDLLTNCARALVSNPQVANCGARLRYF